MPEHHSKAAGTGRSGLCHCRAPRALLGGSRRGTELTGGARVAVRERGEAADGGGAGSAWRCARCTWRARCRPD